MLAGLNREERVKLNLEGFSPSNLRYLQGGDVKQDEHEDATRFQAWKACLGILGIPFLDVVRVLAAVLLLGNVQFVDGQVRISFHILEFVFDINIFINNCLAYTAAFKIISCSFFHWFRISQSHLSLYYSQFYIKRA